MSSGLAFAKRAPRVLFFINGMNPTAEEREKAQRYLPNVGFRNARMVADTPMAAMEECDFVAGSEIPARYANVYPNVNDFDPARGDRLSDFYLPHGVPTDPNNEAARAAKPDPNSFAGRNPSQGSPTMPGAISVPSGGVGAVGGFVAPTPAKPGAPLLGEGNADNPVAGVSAAAANPFGVPAGGVTAARDGEGTPRPVSTGAAATDAAGSGFTNPAANGFQGGGTAQGDGLEKLSRSELDARATDLGLNPESYPNKGEIIAAIREAGSRE